jgi:radical S-adenosyl methionine domain-containing protein 2
MKIVVWNVTTHCNQACDFCFGPPCGEKEISHKEAKQEIINFARGGVEKLVFTGGEPLLRNDIIDLIKLAKSKGIYTILHTNGLLVTESFIERMEKFLDQINLPLDGFNEDTNDKLRTKGHFRKVIICLEMLKNKDIKIIISTVAVKVNKDYLSQIGEVIPDYIYKWRIFQFNPVGKARNVGKKYAISDEEFEKLSGDIRKKNFLFNIQLVSSADERFYKSYYVVDYT